VGRAGWGSPAAGWPGPLNEIWIGARRLRYEVPLVTLNAAGFTDLTEHYGLVLLAVGGVPRWGGLPLLVVTAARIL
jgi:hypothetical protein